MQTFLPDPDFRASAKVLDRQRLGKQRVETWQILTTLLSGVFSGSGVRAPYYYRKGVGLEILYVLANGRWQHHPAVKMWCGSERTLLRYGIAICEEWRSRGYRDTMLDRFHDVRISCAVDTKHIGAPTWLGKYDFHASHRSNLLRKDQNHYGQFGWTEPPMLPYVWPPGLREFT